MSDARPSLEIVSRILEGEAPANVRWAAARGALPLPRPALVRLQVFLLGDKDEQIRQAASEQLAALDLESTKEVLADRSTTAEVLTHFAARAAREEPLAEQIAFHPEAPTEALGVLAAGGTAPVIELVLTNQQRLLREPTLLERLMINPALRTDQRGRILELLGRVAKLSARASRGEDGSEPGTDVEEGPTSVEEVAQLLDVDVGELMSASEILGGEEFEESDDPDVRSMYRKILSLNAAQKAILAMKGGREERMILIRDSNRTVALGVLKNGRLTKNEVESIAKMRNVQDEVLRHIGLSREWTKSYAVIVSLVSNPRAPRTVSMNFVNRLSNHDLKAVAQSREVPELIRRMARRTLEMRTQPKRFQYKKK